MSASVLIVEDEAPLRMSVAIALKRAGFEVTEVDTVARAKQALESDVFEAVLTDLRLPDGDGIAVLKLVKERGSNSETVMMTAYGSVETAVEAMRLGAHDFIQKPFAPERLVLTVQKAIEHRRLAAELSESRRRLGTQIVAKSAAMREVATRIPQAAGSRAVLIVGETGTGKELVARSIHAIGAPDTPFVVVNCAGLSTTLLESELFGHVHGAFTGATGARRGLLAEADNGTVFLDEIAEIEPQTQVRLLRFLQFGEVRPLGSDRTRTIRARVIAATNRDLAHEIREKRFREDLFYRLDVFRIVVPPLRKRLDDVEDLAEQSLIRLAHELHRPPMRLAPGALERLKSCAWPGNVRELENAMERAVLSARGAELEAGDFILPGPGGSAPSGPVDQAAPSTLAEVERRHILHVLEVVGGDRRKAIGILGISKSTLRRKLMEYGLWTGAQDADEGPDEP